MPRLAIGFTVVILLIVLAADLGWGEKLFNWVAIVPGRDFTGHFVLIGLLSLTTNLALQRRTTRLLGGQFQLGSVILLPIVTLEEFSQLWISTRGFSLFDLAADYLGIWLLGGVLSGWLQAWSATPDHGIDPAAEEDEIRG